MSKLKTNKEYAIKLTHPEFGDYYFSYDRWNIKYRNYIFTKSLKKVMTWKTIKFAEKQINLLLSNLNSGKGKVLLSFIDCFDDNIKSLIITSRKKNFYVINSVNYKTQINQDVDVYLDIIDASFGFRLLKLKELKNLE